MGLDMFLFRRSKGSEEYVEAGYWRKANHIHSWFVDNCQDGVDECQETVIPKEKLEELLETCRKVLNPTGSSVPIAIREELAESMLPTREGFFFGSTGYDEGYYEDIRDTIGILERVLAETNFETDEIFYQSSW